MAVVVVVVVVAVVVVVVVVGWGDRWRRINQEKGEGEG